MLEIQNFLFNTKSTVTSETEYKVEKPPIKIETNFKLPISYLEPSECFVLSDVVSNDLELTQTATNSKSMYEHLFQPKHQFAKDMIEKWRQTYTINQEFLKDTQQIIFDMNVYKDSMLSNKYQTDSSKITTIWEDLKVENGFLDRYGFLDWDMLAHLNESSIFLQSLTVMNVLSPAISLLMPLLFFIFPFLILKVQGIPITFDMYMLVLKDLARNHFIGKALMTMESLSLDKIIYLCITFIFYLMQIYQNIHQCQSFYKNTRQINEYLIELREFTKYSIQSMDNFLVVLKLIPTYEKLAIDIRIQRDELKKVYSELQFIREFEHSFNKFSEVGYMLKCYYRLHSNKDFESCLLYAIGFEGYINNLLGLNDNILAGNLAFSEFDSSGNCVFKEQYYPALINENPVKNDCDFSKNMIISSPNKSGKTTILKTTTINIIFTQQVGCGFYKSGILNPYTHIHSYLNIPDTSARDSLFQAESRRCKEIIDIINKYNDPQKYRHFCDIDELYSGTNPEEASKAGYAFLKYLNKFKNVNYILTTHYVSICKKFSKSECVQNYMMDVVVNEDGTFNYTYKIKKGISKIKGGVRVLKDMNYPEEIIKTIEKYCCKTNCYAF
jgi:hypothetical protein